MAFLSILLGPMGVAFAALAIAILIGKAEPYRHPIGERARRRLVFSMLSLSAVAEVIAALALLPLTQATQFLLLTFFVVGFLIAVIVIILFFHGRHERLDRN